MKDGCIFYIKANTNKNRQHLGYNIKRGQILYVNFGYNILSEFSFPHYCIALHNSSKTNPKVTVLPITSKNKNRISHLPLGILFDIDKRDDIERKKEREALERLNKLQELYKKHKITLPFPAIGTWPTVYPNWKLLLTSYNKKVKDKEIDKLTKETILDLRKFDQFMQTSKFINYKESYAKLDDITTISKARILFPRYKNHFLYHFKTSNDILDNIDNAIVKRLTNFTP